MRSGHHRAKSSSSSDAYTKTWNCKQRLGSSQWHLTPSNQKLDFVWGGGWECEEADCTKEVKQFRVYTFSSKKFMGVGEGGVTGFHIISEVRRRMGKLSPSPKNNPVMTPFARGKCFPSAQGGSEAAPQWDSLLELEGHSEMRVAPRVWRFRWDEIPAGRDTPSRRGFLQLGGRGRAAQKGPESLGTAAVRAFRRGPAGDAMLPGAGPRRRRRRGRAQRKAAPDPGVLHVPSRAPPAPAAWAADPAPHTPRGDAAPHPRPRPHPGPAAGARTPPPAGTG